MTDEGDRYRPDSLLLRMVLSDAVDLEDEHPFAVSALNKVLDLSRHGSAVDRDWALFILATSELRTPDVLAALRRGVTEETAAIRAEALNGLARREPEEALPWVTSLLEDGENVFSPIFDAAEACADPSLVPLLERFLPEDVPGELDAALEACRTGRSFSRLV